VIERKRIEEMDARIKLLRKAGEELLALSEGVEAVKKNVVRLLASTRMLELNISDVLEIL
jgi:hypothetical protein